MNAPTMTIDRRQQYAQREPLHRTADYYCRVMRGLRLNNALTLRFKRQDEQRRAAK